MSVFTMTVWIVAIACATGVLTEYLKTRRKEVEANLRAGERGASESEITALSERVAVLERIIVDRKTDLRLIAWIDRSTVESKGKAIHWQVTSH